MFFFRKFENTFQVGVESLFLKTKKFNHYKISNAR